MPGRRWTNADFAHVQKWWGERSVPAIAAALGRTPRAVAEQAMRLGLGAVNRGLTTVYAIERECGYDRERVQKACVLLGIRLTVGLEGVWGRGVRSGARGLRRYVPEARLEELLAFLARTPDGERLYDPRGRKTARTMWGTGGKPPACTDCGTTERPHEARGRCARCARRAWRAGRRARRAA